MIDKQKLLQWVKDEIYVNSEPYEDTDTPEEILMFKYRVNGLRKLEMIINSGNLDVEEVAHEIL